MRSHTRLRHLSVWLATTSLCLTAAMPAMAQPAPPAGAAPGAEQAGDQNTDPPALAGRVAAVVGSVSFHSAGETQWSAATLNYPVTNGEAFWTEPQAQATLEIADDRVVLAASTELDVAELDQAQFTTTAAQGAVFLQLNSLPQGQNVTINTPRGAVQITAVGRYEIVAGDTNDATMVSVVEGAAHVAGTDLSLDIGPQQTATIGGTDKLQGSVGPLQQDAFLEGLLRAPARRSFAAGVPRQVQYMTGAADLQTYGSFSQSSQYGQVWYPRGVAANWAPYRDGHWSYVHPWGWTWVDNARWGFAPFHYGRWVEVQNRWGWIPGGGAVVSEGSPYPVYSPALVSFVDVDGAALAGADVGFGGGRGGGGYAPAWVPLGPREPYYPWYHCQPSYFARLNSPYGVPEQIIQRGPTYINNTSIRDTTINNTRNVFINQRAATVIPAAAFTGGRSVSSFGRPLPVAALANARPFVGRLAVAPTAETPNLPRGAARRYNIAETAAPIRSTAGPRIVPAVDRPHGAPELRRAALPPSVRAVPAAQVRNETAGQRAPLPGQAQRGPDLRPGPRGAAPGVNARGQEVRPGAPGAAAIRPQNGLPPLRAPGSARPDARLGTRPDNQRPGEPVRPQGNAASPLRTQPGAPVQAAHPGAEPRGEGHPQPAPGVRATEPRTPAGTPRPDLAGQKPGQEHNAAEPQRVVPPAHVEAHPQPVARPDAAGQKPGQEHNAVEPHRVVPPARVEAHSQPVARPEAAPAQRRMEPPRPAQAAHEAAHPAVRQEAPKAAAPRPAPRPEPARAAPRPEPVRPVARPEPTRAAPRPQPPRAEPPRAEPPHAQPARPAPRAEPARPAPRAEPARPAPHVEAPRPAPAPRPEPRPAPAPAHPAPGNNKKAPPKT